MDPYVQVEQVSLAELDSEALAGGGIDVPEAGARSSSYALETQGWALGRRAPAVAVEFSQPGTRPWQVPLDSGRFDTSINTLKLPLEFELSIRAVLEDDSRADLGTIDGKRVPLRSGFEPQIQPLILTSLGRTGTTMVTALLDAHPEVFAFPPFRYEPRVIGYWLGVLSSLSEPAGYVRQVVAPYARKGDWWIATDLSEGRRRIPDAELEAWIGAGGVEAAAAFCQSRIDALYGFAAGNFGSGRPGYFLEKYEPGWIPSFVSELYPSGRELVLVRDFRDMVCSVLAFNEKLGYQAFLRERVETDEQYIYFMSEPVSKLWETWQARKGSAHLLRYEDLVLRPAATLEELLRYLGVERDADTIEAMLGSLAQHRPETDEHRTTASAEDSVGRWRDDLPVELQRACEASFGPALEGFGYDLSGLEPSGTRPAA